MDKQDRYVDAYVIPVPKSKVDAYKSFSRKIGDFPDCGCHGIDVVKRHEGNGQVRAGVLEGKGCGVGEPDVQGRVKVPGGRDKSG